MQAYRKLTDGVHLGDSRQAVRMTDLELSSELRVIDEELDRISAAERDASEKLEHQWAADQAELDGLLRSIEEAERSGQWRN
jgi:hypothetical protein